MSDRLLLRERVLRLLDEARAAPVLCWQAPGGFGKTTALAQWLARDSRLVVWLSVRPGAADVQWLAKVLLDELADRGLVSQRDGHGRERRVEGGLAGPCVPQLTSRLVARKDRLTCENA